jgi:hypothetical protein
LSRAKVLRDDDVERLAERFRFREAEDALGAFVPEADHTLRVGVDDGIGRLLRERAVEALAIGSGHSVRHR